MSSRPLVQRTDEQDIPNSQNNLNANSLNGKNANLDNSQRESSGSVDREETKTSKRKKVRFVTPVACTNCRKSRSKCTGETPCGFCFARNKATECFYEPHNKINKEKLIATIKESQAIKHMVEKIFESLATEEDDGEILNRIRNRVPIQDIARWLETEIETKAEQPALQGIDNRVHGILKATSHWTTVTANENVLHHLFSLYFTWVHPSYPLFNEKHFVHSMVNKSDEFCSPLLFNAICAMACHLHTDSEDDKINYNQLGQKFASAVKRNVNVEDSSLTTIQALAVLFLVGCARGRGMLSSVYLEIASKSLENLQHKGCESDGYRQVWTDTVTGINNLNIEWAQITFRMPLPFITEVPTTKSIEEIQKQEAEMDSTGWGIYRFPEDDKWTKKLHSLIATTNRAKMSLMAIIRTANVLMYNPSDSKIVAQDILDLYRRLLAWYQGLPSILCETVSKETQVMPHVLSLHLSYATAVVQLLYPLLSLESFHNSCLDSIVWQHAQQGLAIVDNYRVHYSYSYQPVLQVFAILNLTDVIVRYSPRINGEIKTDDQEAVKIATEVLIESLASFPVAAVCMEKFREITQKNLFPLVDDPNYLPCRRRRKSRFLMENIIDACTRTTYIQPVDSVQSKFASDISWNCLSVSPEFGFLGPFQNVLMGLVPFERVAARDPGSLHYVLNSPLMEASKPESSMAK